MSQDGNRHSSGARPIAATFAGRIRFERQVKGWTQAELATKSGLSVDEIARLECGDLHPTLAIAMRLSVALDISIRQLAHAAPDPLRATRRGIG